MQELKSWLSDHLATIGQFGGLWVALGVVSLILTLLALPLIVLRLPADYFVQEKRVPVRRDSRHPVIVWLVPGQGLLTMLIGVLLTNFPGKFRLECALVRRPAVLRTLNRIRLRAGQEPLDPPDQFHAT